MVGCLTNFVIVAKTPPVVLAKGGVEVNFDAVLVVLLQSRFDVNCKHTAAAADTALAQQKLSRK